MDLSNPGVKDLLQQSFQFMQQHPDEFQGAAQNMERFVNPNYHGDKMKLVQQHRKAYKDTEKLLLCSNYVSSTNPFISKKGFDSATCGDRKATLSIPVAKLQVNTVHHGRVLRGTLIEKPYVIQGVHCLLEDIYGGVVKVCFYPHELEQGSSSFNDKWKIGQQTFPEGTEIEIFEPYFKASMDGTYLVRVDNMADVEKDQSCLEPTTPMSLNEEGKRHVAALQYDEAIMSFKEVIKHLNKAFPLYQILLQNLSLVHIHLNHYNTALQCAIGAILMNSVSAPKGFFRAAIALDELKCPLLAIHCCRFTLEQNRSASKDLKFRTLYKKLESIHSTASSMTLEDFLNDDRMIKLLTSNQTLSLELVEQKYHNDPNVIKQLGNEFIGKGDYLKAREFYEIALHKLESMQSIKMSNLFSNISLCYFKSGQYHNSIINASTSMVMKPTNKKAHYRCIESLLNLDMTESAKICFDFAKKSLCNDSDCLNPLVPRLVSNLKKSNDEKKPKSMLERYKPKYASYQSVEYMNSLIEMSGKGQGFLRDIPSFHIKYSRAKQWPYQSNPEKCIALLDEAHALGRSDMHRFVLENMPKSILDTTYFMKRLGSNDKNHVEWLLSSNNGDVSFRKRSQYASGNIHHSFGNVAQFPQILRGGTTHVSVGFADLQEISICRINDSENNKNKPLRWVGYDSSPYVVAKTMALIEMMRDKVTPVESVAQVWFSAAWSGETLEVFRKALTSIISTKGFSLLPHLVQELLIYWQHHDISLKSSREEWMKNHTCSWSDEICNWKREQDYLAICTYAMTGQLHYDNLIVGSVVMFALPEDGKVADNEDVFQVVNLKELIEHYDQHSTDGDCVKALTTLLEGRIHRLKRRIQSQNITVEVHCEEVNLKNEILIDKICNDLRPRSMSWSNVCDYIDPVEFHMLARKCSVGNETIHFGYSMNWPQDVKGAFIGDFCLGEENDELKDFIKESIRAFENSIEVTWKHYLSTAFKYLTFPPHTNPMNVIDWGLTNRMQLYETWFQAFIHSGGEMMEHQFGSDMNVLYQFNQRTNSVLLLHWTYDSEINMVPKTL